MAATRRCDSYTCCGRLPRDARRARGTRGGPLPPARLWLPCRATRLALRHPYPTALLLPIRKDFEAVWMPAANLPHRTCGRLWRAATARGIGIGSHQSMVRLVRGFPISVALRMQPEERNQTTPFKNWHLVFKPATNSRWVHQVLSSS